MKSHRQHSACASPEHGAAFGRGKATGLCLLSSVFVGFGFWVEGVGWGRWTGGLPLEYSKAFD